jgi:Ca2+-transporting ATPase
MTFIKKVTHPWSLDEKEILKLFGINKNLGLSEIDAEKMLFQEGENILKIKKKISHHTLFMKQFQNPMALLLFSAAVLALALGETIDAFAIFSILLLNGFISFIQELKASEAIDALKELSVPMVRVLRMGKVNSIPSEKIVSGDIIFVEAGDYVTADARILEAHQLSADESTLTGESVPVKKNIFKINNDSPLADRNNMLHAGTAISQGSGKALVTATGMRSEIGQVAELLSETITQETPLQLRLKIVSNRLFFFGIIIILLMILIRYLEGETWLVIFMSAISLAVAAIPEGLPTVVTLALALAVRRMTKRNTIMRNLAAVETLGSTDVICTDKTGTLTTGIMSVREVFLLHNSLLDRFIEGMVLCNNASLDNGGSGDPTEKALLSYVYSQNINLDEIKTQNPRSNEWSFDSDRKRMSIAIKTSDQFRIITKGAPETMIERCLLSQDDRDKINERLQSFTSKGFRLLAVADKFSEITDDVNSLENQLHFLGLVAISDPPKSDTLAAIKECKNAGIKVVMITGDHPSTAKSIALELGISSKTERDDVITGSELEQMDFEELKKRVEHISVYARVTPVHKLNIIHALQTNGHVVAMTGDGVNDAPALRKAQIGVAMGKAGTEVARQASSMILTDDNFSNIVHAVEEGRAIYGNIKRSIQYLLSTNLSEILIVFGASIFNLPVPFTPIGLLWINLVTDGFPALALASEPLEKNILQETTRPSPATFFDRAFILELFFVGFLMGIMCLSLFYFKVKNSGVEEGRTFVFSLLVFMSLFRSFSCRSEKRSFFQLKLNYFHLGSVLFPITIHLTLDHFEFYQRMLKIHELSLKENLLIALLSLLPVTMIELYKLFKHS